jgi:glycosyltransferase involved in cell wall biosynthesis
MKLPMKLPGRPRVLVLADVPSPHQNVFFDAVSDLGEVELEVTFCRRTMPGRAWSGQGPARARSIFLPEFSVGGVPTNPTLVAHLLRRRGHLPFVLGYYLPGLLAAGLTLGALGRPWVFWMDALQPLRKTGPWLKRLSARRARKWYLDRATAFLSTGEKGRAALLEAGVPPERAFEIPFVVDADWIRSSVDAAGPQRERIRQDLGVPADGRLLLFVGQLIRRKGIDLLIQADTGLPDDIRRRLHVLLIGDGEDKATFEAQVQSTGAAHRFHFLPNLDISLLPVYWAACDALVLPSRFDAWGVVVDEALTAGLPVLGTEACGAVVDRVRADVNGWRYAAEDFAGLRHHLSSIVDLAPLTLEQMSQAARASMDPFSPRAMARKFTEVVTATNQLALGRVPICS